MLKTASLSEFRNVTKANRSSGESATSLASVTGCTPGTIRFAALAVLASCSAGAAPWMLIWLPTATAAYLPSPVRARPSAVSPDDAT